MCAIWLWEIALRWRAGGWRGYCGFCAATGGLFVLCFLLIGDFVVVVVVGILLVWVFYCGFGCGLYWWFCVFSAVFGLVWFEFVYELRVVLFIVVFDLCVFRMLVGVCVFVFEFVFVWVLNVDFV